LAPPIEWPSHPKGSLFLGPPKQKWVPPGHQLLLLKASVSFWATAKINSKRETEFCRFAPFWAGQQRPAKPHLVGVDGGQHQGFFIANLDGIFVKISRFCVGFDQRNTRFLQPSDSNFATMLRVPARERFFRVFGHLTLTLECPWNAGGAQNGIFNPRIQTSTALQGSSQFCFLQSRSAAFGWSR